MPPQIWGQMAPCYSHASSLLEIQAEMPAPGPGVTFCHNRGDATMSMCDGVAACKGSPAASRTTLLVAGDPGMPHDYARCLES